MGLFNFLMDLFREDEDFEEKKIDFSGLENWIDENKDYIENREDEIFSLLKEKIETFNNDLREKIDKLEEVDVDKKRTKDQYKTLTKEGRKKYTKYLEGLMRDLEKIEKNNFDNMAKRFNYILQNFNKRSRKNYERTTILIGDEAGEIRDAVRKFYREIKDIFNSNKEVSILSKTISIVESDLEKVKGIKGDIERHEDEISDMKNAMKEKKKNIGNISEKIEKTEESKEHRDRLKKIEDIKKQREELDQEIFNLGKMIDFKRLGDFYHSFKDKIKKVKAYKNNLKEQFKRDPKKLLKFLEEANMETSKISDKIKQIEEKQNSLEKLELEIENSEDKLAKLKSKQKRMKGKIEDLKDRISREEKRINKKIEKKDKRIDNIVKEMKNVNVEIILEDK